MTLLECLKLKKKRSEQYVRRCELWVEELGLRVETSSAYLKKHQLEYEHLQASLIVDKNIEAHSGIAITTDIERIIERIEHKKRFIKHIWEAQLKREKNNLLLANQYLRRALAELDLIISELKLEQEKHSKQVREQVAA